MRKPTDHGIVASLEFYDRAGEPIALFVGKRKHAQLGAPAWRSLVEALPASA